MSKAYTDSYLNADGVPEIRPDQLKENADNVFIVDVRRPEEFGGELGHITGAKLMTLETELQSKLGGLDKSQSYVFVCRSGRRSTKATLMAQELGFVDVYNMQGGMLRWNAMQFPVEK